MKTQIARPHFYSIFLLLALQCISVLMICITTQGLDLDPESIQMTTIAKKQIIWFGIGWGIYLACAFWDYGKLKNISSALYVVMILSLIGLFFTSGPGVQRWYRLPMFDAQPSEWAKLILLVALSHFLEWKQKEMKHLDVTLLGMVLVLCPVLLVLKQPDLGTALIILLEGFALLYMAGAHKRFMRLSKRVLGVSVVTVSLIFLNVLSYERLEPVFLKVLKEYQVQRLSPESFHQRASLTAIGLGGVEGVGMHGGTFSTQRYLPAAHTDSIFPAFAEHFGLIGSYLLIGLFFLLVYAGLQMAKCAKDRFGQLLGFGIIIHFALHVCINLGMMSGIFPITGVPLLLMTYGGSATLCSMAAFGLLQSIYMRRFRF